MGADQKVSREDALRIVTRNHFYLTSDNSGKPFVSLVHENRTVTGRFTSQGEWQVAHAFNTVPILWDTFDSKGEAVFPHKVDVSDPNTAYFYFSSAQTGTAIVASGLSGSPSTNGQLAKVWCDFDVTGGTVVVRASFGLSSITDGGVGVFTANFNPTFTSANYAFVVSASTDPGLAYPAIGITDGTRTEKLAGSTLFRTARCTTNALYDPVVCCFVVFGVTN